MATRNRPPEGNTTRDVIAVLIVMVLGFVAIIAAITSDAVTVLQILAPLLGSIFAAYFVSKNKRS